MKTRVAIVGAGPSGLLLGHLLRQSGVDCVIVERQAADYVLSRIRAGVLETVTTDLMHKLGIDRRMDADGMIEDGFNLADGERLIRIDIKALTGKHVMVYGQTELTRDLMEAAPERGLEVIYEAKDVALHDLDSASPVAQLCQERREPSHRGGFHRRLRRLPRPLPQGDPGRRLRI
jgi:p-hydroxybenzoate 3-monooxygenase